MNFPDMDHGILIELATENIDIIKDTVESTNSLEFIAGYKITAEFALKWGIEKATAAVKNLTELPLIYDHCQFGSDSPHVCSGTMLDLIASSGIDGITIVPYGGILTLKNIIEKCLKLNITPIVGGDMTHEGYSQAEEGYIDNISPQKMYIDGANFGAMHFIIPCSRTDRMKIYCRRLESIVNNPVLFITGFSTSASTSGDMLKACEILKDYKSFAVIGKEIIQGPDRRKAAESVWEMLPAKK